ncbi:MAG: M20/M25/M40 family metallo-hydrolase, partial [Planctomycetes bacterium]|nr:M20/M25/M40 family metallo-hydrolase [Planctomycetota bacterium]
AVTNPANVLAGILAALHDEDGRVTIPGFYDDVAPLSDQDRRAWRELPFDEAQYARSLGVEACGGGEKGYSVLERRWARPTLDCNGITGGYAGPGAKTIIPAEASAKFSMRLVPDQRPEKIVEALRRFVAEHVPPGVRWEMKVGAQARPVMLARDCPSMRAAAAALKEAFGKDPAFVRCGASVPITELIQRLLGLDAALMGFGLPDDNLHSPNERYRLSQFAGGCIASAAMMNNLAEALTGRP